MNNGRFALTRYWNGYRAARDTAQACGLEWAREIVNLGVLKGKSPAYIKGYLRYVNRQIEKGQAMKNIIDFSKTRLKALQRFRKGKGRWGIYQGHFFVMNPDQTTICFVRPREFDASKGASVNFSPWAAPLDIANYEVNLETGEIIDTIKGEAVEIESKPITSQFLDPYLYPWKYKESAASVAAPRVGVGTAKLAMQTFEAFGIDAFTMDFHSAFQFCEGYTRDTVVYIVLSGVR